MVKVRARNFNHLDTKHSRLCQGCQGDERSGSGAGLLETAALVYPAKGRVDGSGTLILAGSGLQRVGPSVCAGCGFPAGSGVAASRDTFLKRTVPDSRREAHALPKPDDTAKHPGARHRPPRDRYFLRPRGRARRPRSLSNRPNMAPGRTAHV